MKGSQAYNSPNLSPEANVFGHTVPLYSTDIAAAMTVAEKIGEHYSWTLHLLGGPDEKKYYRFWIAGQDVSKECDADTAPLAICRAAMKWAEARDHVRATR